MFSTMITHGYKKIQMIYTSLVARHAMNPFDDAFRIRKNELSVARLEDIWS